MSIKMPEEKESLPPPRHHASTSAPHLDGAFTRKLDPKEQARMNAMMSNMSKQASQFITNQTNVTATIPTQGDSSTADGALDLKAIPTLYFKGCKGCSYTVDHRTTKVLIEDCQDTTFSFNNTILTSSQATHTYTTQRQHSYHALLSSTMHCLSVPLSHTLHVLRCCHCSALEAWKCKNVSITSSHQIKTMQLDLSHTFTFTLPSLSDFGTIVWNSVEVLTLQFLSTPEHNTVTGFAHVLPSHPDSNIVTDQFIIRSMNDSLLHERCIRLNNGFLSTEREAVDWDRRAELSKERYVQQFIKDSGITIKKKQEKAVPPNDPCPCQSGAKYKKCCFNKKVLSGVEGEVKADVYRAARK
jgi:SEC-C motif